MPADPAVARCHDVSRALAPRGDDARDRLGCDAAGRRRGRRPRPRPQARARQVRPGARLRGPAASPRRNDRARPFTATGWAPSTTTRSSRPAALGAAGGRAGAGAPASARRTGSPRRPRARCPRRSLEAAAVSASMSARWMSWRVRRQAGGRAVVVDDLAAPACQIASRAGRAAPRSARRPRLVRRAPPRR